MATYIKQINAAIGPANGVQLAQLLKVGIANPGVPQNNAVAVSAGITHPLWRDVVAAHMISCQQGITPLEKIQAQERLFSELNRVAEKEDSWILPILYRVSMDLRETGREAKRACTSATDSAAVVTQLESSSRVVNRALTLCLNDRNPRLANSKKWGTYFFVGELCKLYFLLDKRPMCKSVVKVLQGMAKDLPPLDAFPKSHTCTYLYYRGVLSMMDDDVEAAHSWLTRALKQCFYKSTENQELILLHLIPAQFLMDRRVPSKAVWQAFPRLHAVYHDMLTALLRGDILAFDSAVKQRRSLFVKKYLYLTIEKMRVFVFEKLFYRVHKALDGSTRVTIADFRQAAKHVGADVSGDYLEAALSNMIYNDRLKGYISRERHTVVLRGEGAFPKVPLTSE